jgi:hypothetical protein
MFIITVSRYNRKKYPYMLSRYKREFVIIVIVITEFDSGRFVEPVLLNIYIHNRVKISKLRNLKNYKTPSQFQRTLIS